MDFCFVKHHPDATGGILCHRHVQDPSPVLSSLLQVSIHGLCIIIVVPQQLAQELKYIHSFKNFPICSELLIQCLGGICDGLILHIAFPPLQCSQNLRGVTAQSDGRESTLWLLYPRIPVPGNKRCRHRMCGCHTPLPPPSTNKSWLNTLDRYTLCWLSSCWTSVLA